MINTATVPCNAAPRRHANTNGTRETNAKPVVQCATLAPFAYENVDTTPGTRISCGDEMLRIYYDNQLQEYGIVDSQYDTYLDLKAIEKLLEVIKENHPELLTLALQSRRNVECPVCHTTRRVRFRVKTRDNFCYRCNVSFERGVSLCHS